MLYIFVNPHVTKDSALSWNVSLKCLLKYYDQVVTYTGAV